MGNFRKTLVIGLTVLGLGAGSFAVQAQQGAPGAGHETRGEGRHAERMAKRQAELHDKLKLSASQEPAWSAFTASMKPTGAVKRPDRAEWEKLSAPERMERRMAMMKQAEGPMQARLAAMKTFYAQLTPEQQKVFNENVGGGHKRDGGHRQG